MRQRTRTDILVGIKQTAIATSFGSCELPILYRDGSLLVVGYRIDPARVRFGGARTVQLTILGDGATAATVRTLGLDAIRPAFAFRTDSFKAVLPLGKDLGAIGA